MGGHGWPWPPVDPGRSGAERKPLGGSRQEWQHPRLLLALLLLWYVTLWTGHEAAPLDPVGPPALPLPHSFVLKCSEQARRVQAKAVELQEKLVSGGPGSAQGGHQGGCGGHEPREGRE